MCAYNKDLGKTAGGKTDPSTTTGAGQRPTPNAGGGAGGGQQQRPNTQMPGKDNKGKQGNPSDKGSH